MSEAGFGWYLMTDTGAAKGHGPVESNSKLQVMLVVVWVPGRGKYGCPEVRPLGLVELTQEDGASTALVDIAQVNYAGLEWKDCLGMMGDHTRHAIEGERGAVQAHAEAQGLQPGRFSNDGCYRHELPLELKALITAMVGGDMLEQFCLLISDTLRSEPVTFLEKEWAAAGLPALRFSIPCKPTASKWQVMEAFLDWFVKIMEWTTVGGERVCAHYPHVLCCAVLCYAVLCCAMLCCTTLLHYCTVLHCRYSLWCTLPRTCTSNSAAAQRGQQMQAQESAPRRGCSLVASWSRQKRSACCWPTQTRIVTSAIATTRRHPYCSTL